MDLREVNPNDILIPEMRVTARFSEEEQHQFAQSVKGIGIDDPIKCYEVEGKLILSDGLHRLQQAVSLKMPTIKTFVRPGTMEEVLCNNLMSGHLRGKHPISEMVKVIEYLWTESKWGIEKIVEKTGMTRDYVEKLISISKLTPMCRAALDEDRIKIGHAAALTKIKDPVIQETVLGQQLLYRWTVRDLEGYISDQLTAAQQQPPQGPQAPPPPPFQPVCFYCKQPKDLAEIANPNTCQSCAGILLETMSALRREQAADHAAALK